ncbi:MAG: hypothetical protein Q9217_002040 [Psora testacea]
MSLNGLEASGINEAYQAALNDGGCWFAFLVRVAVHFQSITDKFSPNDATFSYSTAAELRESALSSEIALHTAASIKSTSDPQLPEITEDEQDAASEATQRAAGGDLKDRSESSQNLGDAQTRQEKVTKILDAMQTHERSPSLDENIRLSAASNINRALPAAPSSLTRDRFTPQSTYDLDQLPCISSVDGSMSSQSARPSSRELGNTYEYKPKAKFGPRPSADSTGRANNFASNGFRPISTLPANLHIPGRKAAPGRSKSEQKQPPFLAATPPHGKPVTPPPPVNPLFTPDRKISLPANGLTNPAKTSDPKSGKVTPEKRRLMKALQLRQKQLAAQKLAREAPSKKTEAEGDREVEGLQVQALLAESQHKLADTKEQSQDLAKENSRLHLPQNLAQDHTLDYSSIVAEYSQDSPTSGPEPSEGQSTQASSISEEDPIWQKSSHNSEETVKAVDKEQDAAIGGKIEHGTPQRPITKAIPMSWDKDSLQHVKVAPTTQDPNSMPVTRILSNDESSTKEFDGDCQLPEAGPPVPECENDRRHTNLVTPAEGTSLAQTHSATGQALANPVEKAVAANPTEDITLVPCKRQNSAKMSNDDKLDGALMLDPGRPKQAGPVAEDVSLQVLSESDNESPPFQSLPHVIGDTPDELGQGGDASNTPNGQSCLDNGKESLEQDSTTEPTTLKATHVPATAYHPRPEPSLHTTTEGEDSNSAQHANAKQQRAPQAVILVADIESEAETTTPPSLGYGPTVATPSATEAFTRLSTFANLGEFTTESRQRRHGLINPTTRNSSPDHSEEQFLADDSFMEELKTVSVQEAKPISVSKSPIKPIFSRNTSEQKSPGKARALRNISNPLGNQIQGGENTPSPPLPAPSSARSFSASNPPFLNPQAPISPHKKHIAVSSTISQRIKALEQLSSRPTSPTLQSTPQATFVSLRDRNSSFRSPAGTSSGTGNNANPSRPSTANALPSTSPHVIKSNPVDRFGKTRPESISVTATIIRDSSSKSSEIPLNLSEPRHTNLYQSPLFVEHEKMGPPPLSPLKPPRPQYARHASARSGSSSSTNELSPTSRRASLTSKRSASSRNDSDLDLPRSASDKSFNGVSGLDGIKEERKDSKRSRLLRRMSSITSMSRRSIASALSPGPKEASIIEHQEPVAQTSAATPTDLGDVNVQFPDTLLWKRRHMLIDEHGVLVLSPLASDKNTRVITKRFALSDFRQPYLPDQDRQELANSKSIVTRVPLYEY